MSSSPARPEHSSPIRSYHMRRSRNRARRSNSYATNRFSSTRKSTNLLNRPSERIQSVLEDLVDELGYPRSMIRSIETRRQQMTLGTILDKIQRESEKPRDLQEEDFLTEIEEAILKSYMEGNNGKLIDEDGNEVEVYFGDESDDSDDDDQSEAEEVDEQGAEEREVEGVHEEESQPIYPSINVVEPNDTPVVEALKAAVESTTARRNSLVTPFPVNRRMRREQQPRDLLRTILERTEGPTPRPESNAIETYAMASPMIVSPLNIATNDTAVKATPKTELVEMASPSAESPAVFRGEQQFGGLQVPVFPFPTRTSKAGSTPYPKRAKVASPVPMDISPIPPTPAPAPAPAANAQPHPFTQSAPAPPTAFTFTYPSNLTIPALSRSTNEVPASHTELKLSDLEPIARKPVAAAPSIAEGRKLGRWDSFQREIGEVGKTVDNKPSGVQGSPKAVRPLGREESSFVEVDRAYERRAKNPRMAGVGYQPYQAAKEREIQQRMEKAALMQKALRQSKELLERKRSMSSLDGSLSSSRKRRLDNKLEQGDNEESARSIRRRCNPLDQTGRKRAGASTQQRWVPSARFDSPTTSSGWAGLGGIVGRFVNWATKA
ncbi:hypothetical protein CC1G_07919 [Coprinopsis cinerea okayama7|uniref:Uncharacterized protein n=1 Tax=Coprinopsis cinerea (strain Okayama-7 / 130 / ATCC MYA-4618 / FGSC 9003) TaxID=240176 RepID=A8P6Q5_COPC7|nr:hypothetical protein CC1G_07919 [Coprinopsis cinerea okayama7\|eukprot:XP_001839204.2 hypothetical protein CC1G_07919 [Coprinopsis cinerea okayama7\